MATKKEPKAIEYGEYDCVSCKKRKKIKEDPFIWVGKGRHCGKCVDEGKWSM